MFERGNARPILKAMKVIALLMCVALATEVTPVQKVIQLLNGMAEKGKSEKHAEQVQFAAYKQSAAALLSLLHASRLAN